MASPISTIWNADEEKMQSLIVADMYCASVFMAWDIEGIYTAVHSFKRVGAGKFWEDDTYQKLLKEDFPELEKIRRKFYSTEDESQVELYKIKLYNKAESIYNQLCVLCKHHGIYFREGRDPRRAALRV